ncbi:hypothetical protein KPB2_5577 [Klebsiella pneumoniae Kb677]|nr:hypothetical protein KPB2_5577 [Klebsiella pneumoniae Kb677]
MPVLAVRAPVARLRPCELGLVADCSGRASSVLFGPCSAPQRQALRSSGVGTVGTVGRVLVVVPVFCYGPDAGWAVARPPSVRVASSVVVRQHAAGNGR